MKYNILISLFAGEVDNGDEALLRCEVESLKKVLGIVLMA